MAAPYELYIFRQGSTVWRYTNARRAITFSGDIYTPKMISRGKWDKDLQDTGMDVTVEDQDVTPVNNLFSGNVIPLTLEVRDSGTGDLLFFGYPTTPTWDDERGDIRFKALGMSNRIDSEVPAENHGPMCSNNLGDPLTCGVDLTDPSFSVTVTRTDVIVIDSTHLAHAKFANDGSGHSYAADWWAWGIATVGDEKVFISGHVNESIMPGPVLRGIITLMQPFQYYTGTNIVLTAGCRKRKTQDCVGKFDNEKNFRGFRHVSRYDVLKTKAG